jgi:hypothetical protein
MDELRNVILIILFLLCLSVCYYALWPIWVIPYRVWKFYSKENK